MLLARAPAQVGLGFRALCGTTSCVLRLNRRKEVWIGIKSVRLVVGYVDIFIAQGL